MLIGLKVPSLDRVSIGCRDGITGSGEGVGDGVGDVDGGDCG